MCMKQGELAFNESPKSNEHVDARESVGCYPEGDSGTGLANPKKKSSTSPKPPHSAELLQKRLVPPTTIYLSDRDVARRYSVSRPTIWRWVKDKVGFPSPIKIGKGTTRWHIEDLKVYELVRKNISADMSSDTDVVK